MKNISADVNKYKSYKKKFPKYRTPSEFREKVLFIVKKIPKGKTLSYKSLAEKVGRPRAYRAVGKIVSKNFDTSIPCHRVIRSDGSPGEYNKGIKKKIQTLKKEGVLFDKGKI